MIDQLDRHRGCLLGLAVGDAVGTTLEFCTPGSFEPITDMRGGGPFHLPAGCWTDDTTMALCLATSLVECKGFDAHDQMSRYAKWVDDGYLSSTGKCFDIGTITAAAIASFAAQGEAYAGSTDAMSAGNGSLMRLAPIPIFFHPDEAAAQHHAVLSSRTTHAAAECLEACSLFAVQLCRALSGLSKAEVLAPVKGAGPSEGIREISAAFYRDKPSEAIRGSGYVVESLEAALWAFARSESFEEAVLEAANLGDDADTTAAICGQIAGAYYGRSGIPRHWLARLKMADEIDALAIALRKGR